MKLFNVFIVMCSFIMFSNYADAAENKKKSYIDVEPKQEKIIKEKNKIICGYSSPIRVAGFVTNPPFGWVTQEKHKRLDIMIYSNNGYAYDLFEKLAKHLGFKIENVGYPSYQEALKALRQGKVDVVTGAYHNKHNLGVGIKLLYPSFMENQIVPIFVKGKEKQVQSFDDLIGLKGVVRQEEMIYPLVYNQLPQGVQIKQVSGSKSAFQMLMRGEADYMLTSLYSAEAEVRRFKLIDKVHFSSFALLKPSLFFAFSSVSECHLLQPKFSEALKAMKKDSVAYRKYFVSYIDQWGIDFKDEPQLEW